MESADRLPGKSEFRKLKQNIDVSEFKLSNEKNRDGFLNETVSLVIPAYNEEKRIRPFLEEINTKLPAPWEIIVVCDGNDSTARIASSFGGRIAVLEFSNRLGKGGAILEGLKQASGNIVGYVDADGAISSNDIKRIVAAVEHDSDVAVGSRWVRGSKIVSRQPIIRVILGRLYHYLSFALLGMKIKDTQCGIKAMKASLVKQVLSRVTIKNLSFDTAFLYHCQKLGARISEIPITWKDVDGSKVKPVRTAIVMLLSLVGIKIAHSKRSEKFSGLLESVQQIIEAV